jgi:hypothetical protein
MLAIRVLVSQSPRYWPCFDGGNTRYASAALTGIQQPRVEIIESDDGLGLSERALRRFIEIQKMPPSFWATGCISYNQGMNDFSSFVS